VPQSFVRVSELVVLHRDAQRFELLYRSLWRLVHEPGLKHDPSDTDLARLRQMAQSVRRDVQKMKQRIEFRPMLLKAQPVQVCWYEPVHFITELVGAWLTHHSERGAWLLLTPERSLRWDGSQLVAAPPLAPQRRPHGVAPEGWEPAAEDLPWF